MQQQGKRTGRPLPPLWGAGGYEKSNWEYPRSNRHQHNYNDRACLISGDPALYWNLLAAPSKGWYLISDNQLHAD